MTAPWAGREGHSTVIDAAGAIYVIGGYNGTTVFNDVWASTDGGARPDSCALVTRDGLFGGIWGVLGGNDGYSRSTKWC